MTKIVLGSLSLLSLGLCLASAVLHFLGKFSGPDFKLLFLLASLGWFVFATLWAKIRH